MDFNEWNAAVKPLDEQAMRQARSRWDSIAKPVGSLGWLEEIIVRLAGMRGQEPCIDKRAVLVLCADNGVTAQGVAATPADITAVMAGFIAQKRSSVCIIAQQARADVVAVDMGMFRRVDGLLDRRVADGSGDISIGPAMTRQQATEAIEAGIALARDYREQGYDIIATGEMGIGNTTTSAAMAAVLLGRPIGEMAGRGAGLSDEGLARKTTVIQQAINMNKPDADDPLGALAKLGGFDIAGLCGVFLGGARYRLPVIVDGVISAVAALTAARLCPMVRDYMLASHRSAEPACGLVLDELDLHPILDAGMRLGEGTGAVALLPLLDMAIAVYRDLMTFEEIGM